MCCKKGAKTMKDSKMLEKGKRKRTEYRSDEGLGQFTGLLSENK